MKKRAEFTSSSAFWVVAGVLVLALWASGAPAMAYPVFTAEWGTAPVVATALFAVYPIALVIVMVLCGSLSDRYSRRPLLIVGVGIVAAGTALFALAGPLPFAFAGRTLQGAGVGLAMSAASAALVEYNTGRSSSRASSVNSAATAVGAAIAILLGGVLVEYTHNPTSTLFWVLLVAVLALFGALFLLPAETQAGPAGGKRRLVAVPAASRSLFVIGTGAVTVAFVTGAVFLALGAQIIRDLVGTTNVALAAATLATWPVVIVPVSIAARGLQPRTSVAMGGVVAAIGLGFLMLSGTTSSLLVFLVAAILSGVGYGALVYGGLGLVTAAATPTERAGTFSAMYLCAYLAQGSVAVVIGLLATHFGLSVGIIISVPVIAAICLAISIAALPRNRTRS